MGMNKMYERFNPRTFAFWGVVVFCALALTSCPSEIIQTGTTIKNFEVKITDSAGKEATFIGVVDKTKFTIDIIVDDVKTQTKGELAVYTAARAVADDAGTFPLKPTFDTSENSTVKAKSGDTVDFFTKKVIYTITSANGKKQAYIAYLGTQAEIDALKEQDETIRYITGNRITDFEVYPSWGTMTNGLGNESLLSIGQVLEDFKNFMPKDVSEQAIADGIKAWRIVAFVDDGAGTPYAKLFQAEKAQNEKDVDKGTANVSLLNDEQLKMQVINKLLTKFSVPENSSVNPLPGTPQKFYVENKPATSASRYGIRAAEGEETVIVIQDFQVIIKDPTVDPSKEAIFVGVVDDTKHTIDVIVDASNQTEEDRAVYAAAREAADKAGEFPLAPTFTLAPNFTIKGDKHKSGDIADFLTKKVTYTITPTEGEDVVYTVYLGTQADINTLKEEDATTPSDPVPSDPAPGDDPVPSDPAPGDDPAPSDPTPDAPVAGDDPAAGEQESGKGNGITTTWTHYGVPYRVTSQTGEILEYRIWIIPYSDRDAWWEGTVPTDGSGIGWVWESMQ
jgi:hypothetical protein